MIYEKKKKLKSSIMSGQRLDSALAQEAVKLSKELIFDENQLEPTNHVDDEYSLAGTKDPKILITTSRDPSSRLSQFAKEVKLLFPNASRMNRGNYVMKEMVDACLKNEATDLIILHETRGQPDGMIITHFPYGPTAYFSLHNVVLRHDIPDRGTVSEQAPHLIFQNFKSSLGQRISNILKYLYPVPKSSSSRIITFSNSNDYISFRHHVYKKTGKDIELVEVGPRFELLCN
jgi:U3 small nucleolar ribonucleoprotein protein IMP4